MPDKLTANLTGEQSVSPKQKISTGWIIFWVIVVILGVMAFMDGFNRGLTERKLNEFLDQQMEKTHQHR